VIPLWLQFLVATIVVFGSMVAWVYGEKLYAIKRYSGTPSPMQPKEKKKFMVHRYTERKKDTTVTRVAVIREETCKCMTY
jgi:hypothetical protein